MKITKSNRPFLALHQKIAGENNKTSYVWLRTYKDEITSILSTNSYFILKSIMDKHLSADKTNYISSESLKALLKDKNIEEIPKSELEREVPTYFDTIDKELMPILNKNGTFFLSLIGEQVKLLCGIIDILAKNKNIASCKLHLKENGKLSILGFSSDNKIQQRFKIKTDVMGKWFNVLVNPIYLQKILFKTYKDESSILSLGAVKKDTGKILCLRGGASSAILMSIRR